MADGTPTFETQAVWDHPVIPGLHTCKMLAKKGDTIIAVSIIDKKNMSDKYKQYMNFLKIH